MSHSAFYSVVLDRSAPNVWGTVRDFNRRQALEFARSCGHLTPPFMGKQHLCWVAAMATACRAKEERARLVPAPRSTCCRFSTNPGFSR